MRPRLLPAEVTDDPLVGPLRERTDPHVVALVVEGGGMRGAVSAGMCLALETAGLMRAVDRVYGCSSGALTGCFAAAGQAALWASVVEDCACRAFIDPSRAFR